MEALSYRLNGPYWWVYYGSAIFPQLPGLALIPALRKHPLTVLLLALLGAVPSMFGILQEIAKVWKHTSHTCTIGFFFRPATLQIATKVTTAPSSSCFSKVSPKKKNAPIAVKMGRVICREAPRAIESRWYALVMINCAKVTTTAPSASSPHTAKGSSGTFPTNGKPSSSEHVA